MSENPGPQSPEDELRVAFGRAIGFTVAAFALLLGGAVVVILVAAIFLRFMFGG
jgi:hypothetical protein